MYILQNLAYDISFVPFIVSRSYPAVPPPISDVIPLSCLPHFVASLQGNKKRLSHFKMRQPLPILSEYFSA